ncbi:MAG: MotA/TolQ/ExbB proton channel family protein [Lentisphaeria bacterium]|nr:MotA/TolQ/ExbB proton channel family protein [Lentisphaeria bacterium]MBR3505768.1 MotA/TolQ/ExbB proton channel family protein [Lentisphaeria bacterium]MBR4185889.1 MotA/TolQ/ExbB proton channel family protein [Clostridia bacterium]
MFRIIPALFAVLVSIAGSIPALRADEPAAETPQDPARFEVFSTRIPDGTRWSEGKSFVRDGGFSPESNNYIYIAPDQDAELTGLSIPIRENPGAGEYRYITFVWVKWGGTQIGLKFLTKDEGADAKGREFDYTYIAAPGEPDNAKRIPKGLSVVDRAQGWVVVTRDMWKDFGDFTITGVQFLCPERRDAGFDEIFLAKRESDFLNAPEVLPSEAAKPIPDITNSDSAQKTDLPSAETANEPPEQGVKIDWGAQIRAGGFMMYPLYLLAVIAIAITLQRLKYSGATAIAPRTLIDEVNSALDAGDFDRAEAACRNDASTLGRALDYLLKHRAAGREAVSQTAGDIAARDIRTHLSKIYPISIISSLAPLLGLLGTVVGMIEAFGLVALYGDEGGAAILSDSISKALITTAAGLVIAVPAVAAYYLLKNKIMDQAARVEAELEHAVTVLYLEHTGPASAANAEASSAGGDGNAL